MVYGRVELILRHDASTPERVAAICGICIFIPVRGVGELLIASQNLLLRILRRVFIGLGGTVRTIEHSSIKIYLEVNTLKQFEDLIQKIQNRDLHKDIATAIQEESDKFEAFGGEKCIIDPDHFSIVLRTLDGTTIDSENYKSYLKQIEAEVWLCISLYKYLESFAFKHQFEILNMCHPFAKQNQVNISTLRQSTSVTGGIVTSRFAFVMYYFTSDC